MVTAVKMAATGAAAKTTAGRMFSEQPERLAAAWRRERFTELGSRAVPDNLLDGCIEEFIRQIGLSLRGAHGCAWSRTRGVLRLSLVRGDRGLYQEFGALRRCLLDALNVAGASPPEQQKVAESIEEAVDSCLALLRRLENPTRPLPLIPFGGLVVELVEVQQRSHAVAERSSSAVPAAAH